MEHMNKLEYKYINEKWHISILNKVAVIFVIAYFFFPQYFGFPLMGFDLSVQRIGMILFLLLIIDQQQYKVQLIKLIKQTNITFLIALYMMVLLYTMVLRVNINIFMYAFIEFICLFLVIFAIKEVLGFKLFVKLIVNMTLLLCLHGILEFIIQRSLFSYLETLPGLYTGKLIRSGAYRIMGPCNHSLAYGLVLITVTPLLAIDFELNQINILKNKLLFVLVFVNVILTGSRSTLGIFVLEVFLLFLLGTTINRKRTFLFFLTMLVSLAIITVVTYNTSLGRFIMRQLTSVIDEVFGTEYAINFGADIQTLNNSAYYRKLLPKVFGLPWLNPLLGRGASYRMSAEIDGVYIKSIDNFYVAQYIRVAYPGLITYVFFIIRTLTTAVGVWLKSKSKIVLALAIGILCYFINLWWMDTLQTIKYVYILIALLYSIVLGQGTMDNKDNKKSKYIK